MKHLGLALASFSVLLSGIVLLLVTDQIIQLSDFKQQLEQLTQGITPVSDTEPYGGCKEAARYPNTPGWTWCRDRDYLD